MGWQYSGGFSSKAESPARIIPPPNPESPRHKAILFLKYADGDEPANRLAGLSFQNPMRIRPHFTFVLWLVLWIAQWWVLPQYLVRTQELGWYPPEADSIAIPIMGARLIVIFGSIFLAPLLYIACQRPHPDLLSWTVWCPEAPVRSVLWTVVFGLLAVNAVSSMFTSFSIGLPHKALSDVCWIYVHLALRAIFVGGLKTQVEENRGLCAMMERALTGEVHDSASEDTR